MILFVIPGTEQQPRFVAPGHVCMIGTRNCRKRRDNNTMQWAATHMIPPRNLKQGSKITNLLGLGNSRCGAKIQTCRKAADNFTFGEKTQRFQRIGFSAAVKAIIGP